MLAPAEGRPKDLTIPVDAPPVPPPSRAVVTPALIAANLAVFIAMVATGTSPIEPHMRDLLGWGATFGPLTSHGELWRLWTANYLHIGILHLACNMLVLWQVGRMTERLVGRVAFFVMYTASGLVGSLVSHAVHPLMVGAGASGAVFGVFGCWLGVLLAQRHSLPAELLSRSGKNAAVFLATNLLFGLSVDNIDVAAHFGGLAAGFLCGLGLGLQPDAAPARRRTRTALVAAAALAVVAAGVFTMPATAAVNTDISTFEKQAFAGGNTIYYGKGATRAEAQRLAAAFKREGIFNSQSPKDVMLARRGATYRVSFFFNGPDAAHDPGVRSAQAELGALLSKDVFAGAPTEIVLLDQAGNELGVVEQAPPP